MDDIHSKVAVLVTKIDAFHGRQDRMEKYVYEQLKDHRVILIDIRDGLQKQIDGMQSQIDEKQAEIVELQAHMNKSKGWADASKYLIGAVGFGTIFAIGKFLITGSL